MRAQSAASLRQPDHDQAWNRQLASSQDCYYKAGTLDRWVQTAGDRPVRSMTSACPDSLTLDDHSNCVWQIGKILTRQFHIARCTRFPFRVPSFHLNLIVTWHLRK
jgi:hypothetical protein